MIPRLDLHHFMQCMCACINSHWGKDNLNCMCHCSTTVWCAMVHISQVKCMYLPWESASESQLQDIIPDVMWELNFKLLYNLWNKALFIYLFIFSQVKALFLILFFNIYADVIFIILILLFQFGCRCDIWSSLPATSCSCNYDSFEPEEYGFK